MAARRPEPGAATSGGEGGRIEVTLKVTLSPAGDSPVGEWSFRFESSDGDVLASGEGYTTKADLDRAISAAREALPPR